MLYKLTKGTISKLREDAAGVKELQAEGYVLDGECDADGNVFTAAVVFDKPEPEPDQDDAPKKRGPKPKGDKE